MLIDKEKPMVGYSYTVFPNVEGRYFVTIFRCWCVQSDREHNNELLRTACILGKYDKVKALLKKKEVDIDYADADGSTALYHAAHQNYRKITKILLDYGADPFIKNDVCAKLICICPNNTILFYSVYRGGCFLIKTFRSQYSKYLTTITTPIRQLVCIFICGVTLFCVSITSLFFLFVVFVFGYQDSLDYLERA